MNLYVNEEKVCRSREYKLKFPEYEIDIYEVFHIQVFTMPSSIQIELVFSGLPCGKQVDILEVEVPGLHVKALTSSSYLFKEIPFSKGAFEKRKLAVKTGEDEDAVELTPAEIELDTFGHLQVKAEWLSRGGDMPPMKAENLFKQKAIEKIRKRYGRSEIIKVKNRDMYIDMNDPRNEAILRYLRETQNSFVKKLLREDAKNPLHDVSSFRHMLMLAKKNDPALSGIPIPLLDAEIIDESKNPFFMERLNEIMNRNKRTELLEKPTTETEFLDPLMMRRNRIEEKLKKKKNNQKNQTRSNISYKSVVKEFVFTGGANIAELIGNFFQVSRKLKPIVKKRQSEAIENQDKAKILVHIIKGYHIPTRQKNTKEIKKFIDSQSNNRNVDPYYNRPVASISRPPNAAGAPMPGMGASMLPGQGFGGQGFGGAQFGGSMPGMGAS